MEEVVYNGENREITVDLDYLLGLITNIDRPRYFSYFRDKVYARELDNLGIGYDLAKDVHRDQCRESGERYFVHVRAVSLILVLLFDVYKISWHIAALLHDSVEDRLFTSGRFLKRLFGARTYNIIKSVTKPSAIDPSFRHMTEGERLAHYHAKLSVGGRPDLMVKLSDRLHNLLTLGDCGVEKQKRKIIETVLYYEPLIERLVSRYGMAREASIFRVAFALAMKRLPLLEDESFWEEVNTLRIKRLKK